MGDRPRARRDRRGRQHGHGPPGNNTEGNGITGTSGGAYFVDDPEHVQYSVTVPAGATDLRWRCSTDAAYLDTGWFVDDATVDGAAAAVTSDEWVETTGIQDDHLTVQVIASCDLPTSGAGSHVDRPRCVSLGPGPRGPADQRQRTADADRPSSQDCSGRCGRGEDSRPGTWARR